MIDQTLIANRTVSFHTLGCKLNFAETSTIAKQLLEMGYRRARRGETAAVCIINTCSVTELADKKSRQTIRKIAKENPSAYLIVTGCYAQLKPHEVAEIEQVDAVLGTAQKLDIAQFVAEMERRSESVQIVTTPAADITRFVPSCSQDDRTRFFLKVQDGCDYYCTYCTVPYARGRSRNGTIAEICAQAEQAVSSGAREIVLTGVNIGDFGKTTGDRLIDLIRALDQTTGAPRFRISSIEPNLLTDEIIEYVASSRCFVPHFHIPLQSGSDEVLHLMKRRYDTALFEARLRKIKHCMSNAFIGVDVIVGTRGETEAYFADAYRFIASQPICQLHVFSYSERSGTKALEIAHKVTAVEKQRRSKLLLELSDEMTQRFYLSQQGNSASVLFEQPKEGNKMSGFTDNYIRVEAPLRSEWINRIVDVTLDTYLPEKEVYEVMPKG